MEGLRRRAQAREAAHELPMARPSRRLTRSSPSTLRWP
jgi:hypothetical protein